MSAALARRLVERTGHHPVVSLYFDLDPEQFATASARATQTRTLLGQARRAGEDAGALSHEDRTGLAADLERIESYLGSDGLPVSSARALAVFCSGQDDLFETATLSVSTPPSAYLGPTPRRTWSRWCSEATTSAGARSWSPAARAACTSGGGLRSRPMRAWRIMCAVTGSGEPPPATPRGRTSRVIC